MTVFSGSEEFYDKIAEDYRGRAEKSFLYRYLREKKETGAVRISRDRRLLLEWDGAGRDKYILLRGAYLGFAKQGVLKREEYAEIFLRLNRGSKTGVKAREELFGRAPEEAQRALEERLLLNSASNFVDNIRRKKKRENADRDTYTDDVEMLGAYYRYFGGGDERSGSGTGGRADDEYIAKCAELYDIIRADPERELYRDAVIPLWIDSVSGAGVYILGNRTLENDRPGVCVLRFFDTDMSVDMNEYGDGDVCGETLLNVMMSVDRYDSVESAFRDFIAKAASGAYLADYSLRNGDKFPEGADECFRQLLENPLAVASASEIIRDRENRRYDEMERRGIEEMNGSPRKKTP
ncbi:MAG: hypothetical protein NC299_02695 [Lachnospiraceae bacterium]|nr:hypothetical protein [Ruminococcus sp.]MCM1274259.1 hypothetical protein [Lachnospiraceae bacterium]